jgi:cyclin B
VAAKPLAPLANTVADATAGAGHAAVGGAFAGQAAAGGPSITALSAEATDMEVDSQGSEDPQQVSEYVHDICKVWQREEDCPQSDYMSRQPHVNAKMRDILADWLVDVHKKYKLRPETLFLAISLVDHFLEKRVTPRRQLQLIGVTALLVASKFEEIYPPEIKDFVYITDKAYTREDVIKMEVSMLNTLDFKVCRPTAVQFLDRYTVVTGCADMHRDLAQYLLELTLTEYKMVKYTPSHLAAASMLLSNKLLRIHPCWSTAAVKHTRFTEQMLRECAKEICGLFEHAEQSQLQAVKKKFSQPKYRAVSKLSFTRGPGIVAPGSRPPMGGA